MGFSAQKYRKEQQERRWKINPVWRGIGCFLILLIPIMAWFGATILMQTNQQLLRSQSLTKPISIRYSQILEIDRVIADFNHFSITNNLVSGQFLLTIVLMFIGFGILSVVYALMYKVAGPPRYGPFDVPPNSMRR